MDCPELWEGLLSKDRIIGRDPTWGVLVFLQSMIVSPRIFILSAVLGYS